MPRDRSRSPRRRTGRNRSRSRSRSRERRDRRRERRRSRSRSPDHRAGHRRRSRSPVRRRHRSRSQEVVILSSTLGSKGPPRENISTKAKSSKSLSETPQITEVDLEGKSTDEIEMMKLMGFSTFDTTKGKHVQGSDVSAVHVIQKRKYRQYMNRKGGFNRPLDFVA